MNLTQERKKHLCTSEQDIHWHKEKSQRLGFPFTCQFCRACQRDPKRHFTLGRSYTILKSVHSGIHFQTPTSVRGPFTVRWVFENVTNFPQQSRVACRIQKILIWGCLQGDWKGVEAFHLKFNKVVARVGTAYPLRALQAFHSTPTIYWSLSTGFAFPRHAGGITERTKGKNLVLFWNHSQSKHQFHSPAALHMT